MGRAIAVIDVPVDSIDLDTLGLYAKIKVYSSIPCDLDVLEYTTDLRPIPEKRGDITLTERTQDIDMVKWQLENKLIRKGWNACLDEILGEEE